MLKKLYRRLISNQDISLKTFDQKVESEEKLAEYISEGRIANFEIYHLVKNAKQKYCKMQPKIRWHVVPFNLGEFQLALGLRKGLSVKIKEKIHKLFVKYL